MSDEELNQESVCRFLTDAKVTVGERGRLAVWEPIRPVSGAKNAPADIHMWKAPVMWADTRIIEAELGRRGVRDTHRRRPGG